MKRAALAFTLVVITTPALAIDGLYRPNADWADGWDCTNIGSDGGAIAIRNSQFLGVEIVCDLDNPVTVRDMDGVLFDASCTAEGVESSARMLILDTPEGVMVIRRGGNALNLRRCEAS